MKVVHGKREWLCAWKGLDPTGDAWTPSWRPTKDVGKPLQVEFLDGQQARRARVLTIDVSPLDELCQRAIATTQMKELSASFGYVHETPIALRENGRTILARELWMLCRAGGVGGDARGGSDCGSLVCAHMYPVWLYEESLVTISIEFTVILYVRIRVSEDPYFRTRLHAPHTQRHRDIARRSDGVRKSVVGILRNYDSYVQNNCTFN